MRPVPQSQSSRCAIMLRLKNLLLARDFSSTSDQALHFALELARRSGATLHLLYADVMYTDPLEAEVPLPPLTEEERAKVRERLTTDSTGRSLENLDEVFLEYAVERDVAAAPAILSYASDNDVDIIILGTHGRRGVRRVLLGSVAEEVLRAADRPVITVRGEQDIEDWQHIERILVPLDFSEHAETALSTAREFAAMYGAKLDLLHIIEDTLHPAFYVGGASSIYEMVPDIENQVRDELDAMVSRSGGPDVPYEVHVRTGHAARDIAAFADEHTDLIIMPTHGLTGLERFLIGSIAEKVVRRAEVPVLTLKPFGRSLLDNAEATNRAEAVS